MLMVAFQAQISYIVIIEFNFLRLWSWFAVISHVYFVDFTGNALGCLGSHILSHGHAQIVDG